MSSTVLQALYTRRVAGERTAAIAAEAGVSTGYLYRSWRAMGLSLPGWRSVSDDEARRWRRMWLDGLTWAQVGATVGRSAGAVRRRVERIGMVRL